MNTEQLLAVYSQGLLKDPHQKGSAEQEFLCYLREDFFRQKGAFYAVWTVENVYQSALRLEPYADGLLLEALETAPDARRKGYAYHLLSEVLKHVQTLGCKIVYSHVEKRNRVSLHLHDQCGFVRLSDFAVYIDGTVTQNSCTLCFRL